MIVTKFHENRLTIDRDISEKHAILVCDLSLGTDLGLAYNSTPISG